MNSEKVKEIKELLRCMNGEKACTNCYINDIAQAQETCCINVVADMTLDLINDLESENETLRNAKVVYENVDYCYEDLKKAEKKIAELEKGNEALSFAVKQGFNDCQAKTLKQFAERLKEKCNDKNAFICSNSITATEIDETLKEFIDVDK